MLVPLVPGDRVIALLLIPLPMERLDAESGQRQSSSSRGYGLRASTCSPALMNNCYRDFAQPNAGQLMRMLTGQNAVPEVS